MDFHVNFDKRTNVTQETNKDIVCVHASCFNLQQKRKQLVCCTHKRCLFMGLKYLNLNYGGGLAG